MKHLFIHSAWLVVAVLAPMTVTATTLAYVTTTITNDVDQDPNRDGFQVSYNWTVRNADGQAEPDDVVWEYVIVASLEGRGMYKFFNSGSDWSCYSDQQNNRFYFLADSPNNFPIIPGAGKTFSAFIDQDQIIGNEQVGSYGISNEGPTQTLDVMVPLTRSQTSTNGTSFGWLKDHNLVADINSSASYAAAALADRDSDGFANWQEYIADSDPNLSNSYFRVDCTVSNISWQSVTGRVYEVLHADTLFNTFTNAASIEYPTNTFSATAGFYRVRVQMK